MTAVRLSPFGDVALLVGLLVGGGRAAAAASPRGAALLLVAALGDRVPDAPAAQRGPGGAWA